MKLPSRYEDLDVAFRGKLRPVRQLLELVQRARASISVSGGMRFLPIYGESGSGKSSAARELGTHLPELQVVIIPREALASLDVLKEFMAFQQMLYHGKKMLVALVDQYEESVATKSSIPTQFVEWISLLDRDAEFNKSPWLFIWLTTSKEFQRDLGSATSRNRRILLCADAELVGPVKEEWPAIIEETFEFHNSGKTLADFLVLTNDIPGISVRNKTLGATIEAVGELLSAKLPALHDISVYQVVMLWPVTDGQRISTILRFVNAREGYKLDWNAWYRELNDADRAQLPLSEYNRARLYFDMRLVPIAAADIHPLCRDLDDDEYVLHKTYLDRFRQTHFASIIEGTWDPTRYSVLRERESERADDARAWYPSVTREPTKIGKRIAQALTGIGIKAVHEKDIVSEHGSVRADIYSQREEGEKKHIITELKAYSPDNTIPSQIRDAVRTTLKRHAQFAGFIQRQ